MLESCIEGTRNVILEQGFFYLNSVNFSTNQIIKIYNCTVFEKIGSLNKNKSIF